MEFILICSLRSQLSAGPLHFINHISFLFENEKWNWWLIEMKGQRPQAAYKINEMSWRIELILMERGEQFVNGMKLFFFSLFGGLWAAAGRQCSAKKEKTKEKQLNGMAHWVGRSLLDGRRGASGADKLLAGAVAFLPQQRETSQPFNQHQ